MRYAIRQDRKVRKPLPGCQLTETEWLACWDTLNKGIESQDDETIQKSKMLVRSAIKKIYTERYPKSKKCVVCEKLAEHQDFAENAGELYQTMQF